MLFVGGRVEEKMNKCVEVKARKMDVEKKKAESLSGGNGRYGLWSWIVKDRIGVKRCLLTELTDWSIQK